MTNLSLDYQSKRWDADISLMDLLINNEFCKVNRSYKAHKYDDCYDGYCIYVKHPKSDKYSFNIGIWEDGFTYIGDGEINDLPFEKTADVISEVFLFGKWQKQKAINQWKIECSSTR